MATQAQEFSMQLCQDAKGWSPFYYSDGELIMGDCFRQGVVLPSIGLLAMIAFTTRLASMKAKHELPASMISQGRSLLWWKLLLCLIVCCGGIVAIVTVLSQNTVWIEQVLYYGIIILVYAYGSLLHYQNHFKSRRPSNQLCSTYALILMFLVFDIYAKSLPSRMNHHFYLAIGLGCATLALFWLENMSAKRIETRPSKLNQNDIPELYSSYLGKIFIWWMFPLVKKAKNSELSFEDMSELPNYMHADNEQSKFVAIWESKHSLYKKNKRGSPLRDALLSRFGGKLLQIVLLSLVSSSLQFFDPILIEYLLRFINSRAAGEPQSLSSGLVVTFSFLVIRLATAVLLGQQYHYSFMQTLEIQQSLQPLIYKYALKSKNGDQATGKVIGLVSSDVASIALCNQMLQMVICAPFILVVGLWMLFQRIGLFFLVAIVFLIASSPLADLIAGKSEVYRKKQMKEKDARVSLAKDALNGMKTFKLYGWTELVAQKIFGKREKELKYLKSFQIVASLSQVISEVIPNVILFTMFGSVAVFRLDLLSAELVFGVISIIRIISEPVKTILVMSSSLGGVSASMERVQDFLTQELKENTLNGDCLNSQNAIEVEECEFGYESDKSVLAIDKFDVQKGSLTVVVGNVGSGKSALLLALIDEIQKYKGTVRVTGSVAYVSQTAWILNQSIRDNILFGQKFDEDRYKLVIQACDLNTDFNYLADGDQTLVGARGISLSGGQKSRLCCARAIYSNADIILMDDPLSAVDAHVDKRLFNSWFDSNTGILRGRTVILVTNAIHHLFRKEISNIVCIENGKIVEQGTFDSLMNLNGSVSALVKNLELVENESEEPQQTTPGADLKKAQVQRQEKTEKGSVNISVYWHYIKSCGVGSFIIYLMALLISVGIDAWAIVYYLVSQC
jgi:ABC-type multidrug transport system fused ATPase/permease subunit